MREERRQKQRLANVGRAQKMHAARIAKTDDAEPLQASRTPSSGVYVGCSGWYYWHWKGRFYPADVPSNQWFSIYAQQFNTVELMRRSIPGPRSRP